MSFTLGARDIETVQLIDDTPSVRANYRWAVEDLDATPQEIEGGIENVPRLLERFDPKISAVICDYNLKVKSYSRMNGDMIVAGCYNEKIPVVLCTRIEGHFPEDIRRRRRYIPVIISPDELNAESLHKAFMLCEGEFRSEFTEYRQPWRTIIRVEGGEVVGGDVIQVNAVIPEWSSELISFQWELSADPVIEAVHSAINHGDVLRFYATVNVGADEREKLYVTDLSFKKAGQ